ncbi:MAG: preprotein translocase subunit SecG [Gemmatimonadaceae bacterium]
MVLLFLDAITLIGVILVQSGKGGGLAASFGGASSSADAFIGTRQASTIFTKGSWWLVGIFLFLGITLQIMTSRSRAPTSVLDKPLSQQSAPARPSPATSAPAVPLPTQPAPTAPAEAPPKPKPKP